MQSRSACHLSLFSCDLHLGAACGMMELHTDRHHTREQTMSDTAYTMPTQAAMVRRICQAYRAASPAHLAAGLGWYATARDKAERMAPAGTDGSPMVDLAAGVIAALSPRCQWSTNLAWARVTVNRAHAGLSQPAVSTTSNRDHAWRIANGEAPLSVLNGPKVRAFYANIMGDTDAVTVDTWAVRVATGRTGKAAEWTIGTRRRYDAVADAYRRAAVILGTDPRSVQAATWVAARGVKPTDAGFHAASASLVAA